MAVKEANDANKYMTRYLAKEKSGSTTKRERERESSCTDHRDLSLIAPTGIPLGPVALAAWNSKQKAKPNR